MFSRAAVLRSLPVLATAAVAIACGGHNPPVYDSPPVLANREEITEAMRSVGAGLEARVVLLVRVDDQGRVRDVRIEESSGSEELDDAARWIGERMRFEPARHQGRAIASAVQVPISFDVVVPVIRRARLRNLDEITRRMASDYGDLSGEVRLRLQVGTDGWVVEVREGRSNDPALVAAARQLVERMRFQPGSRGHGVVVTWVNVTFQFAGGDSKLLVESSET